MNNRIKKSFVVAAALVAVAAAGVLAPKPSMAAESSYKFSQALDLRKLLAAIFNTSTGHNHDGTNSRQLTGGAIASGSIDTAKLASDAVTTVKILNAAVNTNKLASDSVTTAKILDANVDTNKLATDSVTTAKIIAAAVDTTKIAAAAVTNAKIADGAIDTAKLGLGSVPSVGQVLCVKANKAIGYCTSSYASGICTCN